MINTRIPTHARGYNKPREPSAASVEIARANATMHIRIRESVLVTPGANLDISKDDVTNNAVFKIQKTR